MSEDKNNEEENDNQNEFFDDGDDFGLPDLDYDELDEGEDEEPVEEDAGTEDSDFDFGSDTSDDSLDFGGEEAPSFDEDSVSEEDLSAEDFEISDEDMSEGDEVYGDESFGDFEPDPEAATFAAESSQAAAAAESYKDLADRENKGSEYRYADEKSRSSFTKIVIIGTVVILALASAFWFYSSSQEKAKEQARLRAEQARKEAAAQKQRELEQARKDSIAAAAAPVEETPPPAEAKPQAVAATPGEIRTLDSRTGNSYIIIGSFVDGDLAMDYAKKLAAAGESPTIINPPGKQLFYRVAIASFNSYAEASAALGDFRPNFGNEAWALRY